MTLADVLDRCTIQLRDSPIITQAQIIVWLQNAIQRICNLSQILEAWTIIPVKSGCTQYYLPANHQVTTIAVYDETRLGRCTSFDAQMVSPTVPTYYYEDEWSDDASGYLSTAFLTQYVLLNDLILQWLAREQPSQGRKTITLVGVPAADGEVIPEGSAPIGIIDGPATDPTVVQQGLGVPVYVATTKGNLWIFYKYCDTVPVGVDDEITWNNGLALIYMCGALEIGLSTETDEYDRYRSYLYGQIANGLGTSLRGLSINQRLR